MSTTLEDINDINLKQNEKIYLNGYVTDGNTKTDLNINSNSFIKTSELDDDSSKLNIKIKNQIDSSIPTAISNSEEVLTYIRDVVEENITIASSENPGNVCVIDDISLNPSSSFVPYVYTTNVTNQLIASSETKLNNSISSLKTDVTEKIKNQETVFNSKLSTSISEVKDLINQNSTNISEIEYGLNNIETSVSSLNEKVTNIDDYSSIVNSNTNRLNQIDQKINQLEESDSNLENRDLEYFGYAKAYTDQKIIDIEDKISSGEGLEEINKKLITIQDSVSSNSTKIDNLNTIISGLEVTDLTEINDILSTLKSDVNNLKNNKADKVETEENISGIVDNINAIDKKLLEIVKNIDNASNEININSNNIINNTLRISELDSKISLNSDKLSSLNSTLSSYKNQIDELNRDFSDVKNNIITSLQSNVSSNTEKLNQLLSSVTELENDLSILEISLNDLSNKINNDIESKILSNSTKIENNYNILSEKIDNVNNELIEYVDDNIKNISDNKINVIEERIELLENGNYVVSDVTKDDGELSNSYTESFNILLKKNGLMLTDGDESEDDSLKNFINDTNAKIDSINDNIQTIEDEVLENKNNIEKNLELINQNKEELEKRISTNESNFSEIIEKYDNGLYTAYKLLSNKDSEQDKDIDYLKNYISNSPEKFDEINDEISKIKVDINDLKSISNTVEIYEDGSINWNYLTVDNISKAQYFYIKSQDGIYYKVPTSNVDIDDNENSLININLDNYITKAEASTFFINKNEYDDLVKTSDLENYVQKEYAESTYTKNSDLENYASKDYVKWYYVSKVDFQPQEGAQWVDTIIMEDYVSKSLEKYARIEILSNYCTYDYLNELGINEGKIYINSDNINDYLSSYATIEFLNENYYTSNQCDELFATKDSISQFATKEELDDAIAKLQSINSTEDFVDDSIITYCNLIEILKDYITKEYADETYSKASLEDIYVKNTDLSKNYFTSNYILENYYNKKEVENLLNEYGGEVVNITETINDIKNSYVKKSGDVMGGSLSSPMFIGELEGSSKKWNGWIIVDTIENLNMSEATIQEMVNSLDDKSFFITKIDFNNSNLPSNTGILEIKKIDSENFTVSIKDGNKEWTNIGNSNKWESNQDDKSPVGTITSFAGINPPNGYLLCNGQEILRSEYQSLFDTIGTNYGEGDGETTFNVPDLRGVFLRGLDNGRGIDNERVIGSTQNSSAPNIGGVVLGVEGGGYPLNTRPDAANGAFWWDTSTYTGIIHDGSGHTSNTYALKMDASRNSEVYSNEVNEIRPINVAINYIIKY